MKPKTITLSATVASIGGQGKTVDGVMITTGTIRYAKVKIVLTSSNVIFLMLRS